MVEEKTVLIGLTLPESWVKYIDKQTSVLRNRQDVLRGWIEPHIKEA